MHHSTEKFLIRRAYGKLQGPSEWEVPQGPNPGWEYPEFHFKTHWDIVEHINQLHITPCKAPRNASWYKKCRRHRKGA